MNILFMGTPEFSLPSLAALARSEQRLVGVVTQPDRPQGRKLLLSPPPVKVLAGELGLRIFQPERLSDPVFLEGMKSVSPDLIAVVAYGKYLPRSLWEFPPRGAINLHPSLLPKYRGAAPIQHALLNGESETGVTIFHITEAMDSGDIISRERVAVDPTDTYGSLGKKLFELGAGLLLETVRDIESGRAPREPQDDSRASLAGKIKKADGLIDWSMSAGEIAIRVRAFNPWPSAYSYIYCRGRKTLLKILEAGVEPGEGGEAGRIVRCDSRGIVVDTGKERLVMRRLQFEGKRAMGAAEFLRGHRDIAGVKLG